MIRCRKLGLSERPTPIRFTTLDSICRVLDLLDPYSDGLPSHTPTEHGVLVDIQHRIEELNEGARS